MSVAPGWKGGVRQVTGPARSIRARRQAPVRVYGHRGSRRPGPENTPEAVAAALLAGADGVEIDVRRDAGGRLVVSHDPVTGPAPALADVLDAVLAAAGDRPAERRRVICEVKNRPGEPDFDAPACATAEALVGLLAGRGGTDAVVISSFDWHSLAAVRRRGGPPTAFLTQPGVALRAGTAFAAEHGHAEVHPHWASVTARAAAGARLAGLSVVPWTVRSVTRARRLAALGVDGLICDDPAAVVAGLPREGDSAAG